MNLILKAQYPGQEISLEANYELVRRKKEQQTERTEVELPHRENND
jgi:hypothetical protein